MKILLLLLISSYVNAAEFNQVSEINKVNELTNKLEIHTKLMKLKKNNIAYKKKLQAQDRYSPDRFHYTITLQYLLEKIPSNLEDMPTCNALYHQLLNSYKTSWDKLKPPTHHVWVSFEKICKS
jgi:hypothetical protein